MVSMNHGLRRRIFSASVVTLCVSACGLEPALGSGQGADAGASGPGAAGALGNGGRSAGGAAGTSGATTSAGASGASGPTGGAASAGGPNGGAVNAGGSSAGASNGGVGGTGAGSGGSPAAGGASAGGGLCPSKNACLRQSEQFAAGDDNPANHSLSFEQPVQAGSTVLVFACDMNVNGTPYGTGEPYPIVVSDSDKGTYQELLTVKDHLDWDDVKVFVRTNLPASNPAVQTVWKTNQWHAFMIVEVANLPPSPTIVVAGKLNIATNQTKDAVTSGLLSVGGMPALVLGFGANFRAPLGAVGAPYPGTGFQEVLKGLNWNGKEGSTLTPNALLEVAHFEQPGNVAATFTASPTVNGDDNFVVIGVSLR